MTGAEISTSLHPDRLDVLRFAANGATPRHLTFSHGPHFCVGAPVARLQGEVLFIQLMRRMPDFQLLDDAPPYREAISMRGPRTLRARARSMW
ncbi:hypothetical protein C5E44_00060 [Nocardia nova]|uniref:cytochrome P450 n=1 Tax=Nocardia nova TaxID=37330 RepID=UPI000CE9B5AE|nr:hypothetical protein C5E44_00060 [Nocardia nova]